MGGDAGGDRRDEKTWLKRQQEEVHARKLASVTAAERQVFDGLVAGKTNRMIAEEAGLSVRTVEEHRGKFDEEARP